MTNFSKTDLHNLRTLLTASTEYKGTMAAMRKLINAGYVHQTVQNNCYVRVITAKGLKALHAAEGV